MKKNDLILFFIMFISLNHKSFGQTLNKKDIIISTLLPDNFSQRYNLGFEYFFPSKKYLNENVKFSIALNGGVTSTQIIGQKIKGYDFMLEGNLYTDVLLPKNWNEFGGLKLRYGSFENTNRGSVESNFRFIGLSTGIQPVIAKIVTLKVSSDIGFIRNGLTNMLLLQNTTDYKYSGFSVLFNVGIGIRL